MKNLILQIVREETLDSEILDIELDEQGLEGVDGGGVESGVSDAGGTGAPTWESGISRGHANPVGMTHWADNHNITRGKGNPLTEHRQLLKEYKWYNTVLDLVGIVDPTGIADGINAISYFKQGHIFFGMLSLVSLVPYAGDLIAKPLIGLMKLGKLGGAGVKGINAGAKAGNASKVASEAGKMGGKTATFVKGFSNTAVGKWLTNFGNKLANFKIPLIGSRPFKSLGKDVKTYTKTFTEASKQMTKSGILVAPKVFRKGGPLTKMQRKGLLGRTKLWGKFFGWVTGLGGGAMVLENMSEEEIEEKFGDYMNTPEGMAEVSAMNDSDQEIIADAFADNVTPGQEGQMDVPPWLMGLLKKMVPGI
tara:strand:+ start:33803 stop:34894 length:1092 start_codon:yes stop_codon:yes gene_type:complete